MITVFDLRNAIKDLPDTMEVVAYIPGEGGDKLFDQVYAINECKVSDSVIRGRRILSLTTEWMVPFEDE